MGAQPRSGVGNRGVFPSTATRPSWGGMGCTLVCSGVPSQHTPVVAMLISLATIMLNITGHNIFPKASSSCDIIPFP